MTIADSSDTPSKRAAWIPSDPSTTSANTDSPQAEKTSVIPSTSASSSPAAAPSDSSSSVSPFTYVFWCIVSFCTGIAVVIQAGANIRCGLVLGSGLYGSLVSFTVFIIVVSVPAAPQFVPSFRSAVSSWRTLHVEGKPFEYWYDNISGFLGLFYVVCAVVLSDVAGFSIFFVCSVAGTLCGSLLLDHFGLLGFPRSPLNLPKVLGVCLTLLGALLMQDYGNNNSSTSKIVLSAVISFVAGFVLPFQAGCSKRLVDMRFKYTLPTSVWCTIIATALFVCICAVYQTWVPYQFDSARHVWWQWFGGALGAIYVLTSIVAPRIIGMSLFSVLGIAGQLLTSVFADGYGLFFPAVDYVFSPIAIAGVIIAFVGSAIIAGAQHFQSAHSASAPVHPADVEEGPAAPSKAVPNGGATDTQNSSADGAASARFVDPVDAADRENGATEGNLINNPTPEESV